MHSSGRSTVCLFSTTVGPLAAIVYIARGTDRCCFEEMHFLQFVLAKFPLGPHSLVYSSEMNVRNLNRVALFDSYALRDMLFYKQKIHYTPPDDSEYFL
jgi:hypothetical protein